MHVFKRLFLTLLYKKSDPVVSIGSVPLDSLKAFNTPSSTVSHDDALPPASFIASVYLAADRTRGMSGATVINSFARGNNSFITDL